MKGCEFVDREKSKKVNKQGLTEEEFLAAYDPNKYERPSVTVDMLIFAMTKEEGSETEISKSDNADENVKECLTHKECENARAKYGKGLKLLMIKRGDHPCIGQWALPGGFVNMDENLEDAALRELKEETNISEAYMEQLYTWGDVGRDPRTRIISVSYIALVDSAELNVAAGDDADDAKWFDVCVELLQEQKISHTKGNNIHDNNIHDNNIHDNNIRYNDTFDKSYDIEQTYKLTLKSEDENLSAIIKKIKTINEKKALWKNKVIKTKLEIIEPGGIAFDHAKIIFYGIEKIYKEIVFR